MRAAAFAVVMAALALPCLALPELDEGIRLHERKDYARAAVALHQAALKGSGEACRRLGFMYYHGEGLPQDNAKAVEWFEKAADGGDIQSASNLAMMYEFGMGVARDERLAFDWNRKAAERGDQLSQVKTSVMYYKGEGTARDRVEAAKWWTLALSQGGSREPWIRASVESAERKLTSGEIEEGRRRASEWSAARAGAR